MESAPLVEVKRTIYFRDEKRQIDAILVYKPEIHNPKRNTFLDNLSKQGLEIEQELSSIKTTTAYVKVHGPVPVLLKYAQKHGIPVKFQQKDHLPLPKIHWKCMATILADPEPDEADPVYRRAKDTVAKKIPSTFTSAERNLIVFSIMQYTPYGDGEFDVGLPQLLHKHVFTAAYPLHDGKWEWVDGHAPLNDRQLLAKYWANIRMWNKQQPLTVVEKYFGCDVAMYFGWLGYYNRMLLFASVMGIITFLYGIISLKWMEHHPIDEVCSSEIIMCPMCLKCNYRNLSSYCDEFKYAYINDNFGTVLYSLGMSFWATTFMEMWKRQSSLFNLRWNMMDTNIREEILRPEFQLSVKTTRKHKFTGESEQYVPLHIKCCNFTFSVSIVIFMVLLVLGTIFSIILYECALRVNATKPIIIVLTSSLLTLLVIMGLRKMYGIICEWLTENEMPRTQLAYDKSYMIKMVIFSLVNNYGKLFYLAYFKGKFYTYPGDEVLRENNFPVAADICGPTGCVFELFMLMAIITIIKPIIGNIQEILVPIVCVWIKRFKKKSTVDETNLPAWEQDYDLNETDQFAIMKEFEEMVMQYGFTTFFVVAFPLAPLCAFINNIFEVRIDSTKMVKYYRRNPARRSASFEVWFDTLQAMTYMAVLTNALYITFTSSFVPKTLYYFEYDHSLKGFVQFSLSEYKTDKPHWPNAKNLNHCWYVGYRYPPGHEDEYQHTFMYFYILSARLGFAIIFFVLVLALTGILSYAIPDIPKSVRDRLAYNAKKAREA